MSPEQFIYWLQGFTETHEKGPTDKQWQIIKDHLAEVFDKQTPEYFSPSTITTTGDAFTLPEHKHFIC